MKPKKTPQENRQRDLFRTALSNIIDPNHGLLKLAKVVEWDRLDENFGSTNYAHIILNMNNEDRKIQFSRTVEVLIGIFMALISIFLILLCIAILTKGDFSTQMQMRKGITLFSLPVSFAIFFSVLAINLLKSKTDHVNAELMSLTSWRLLAGIMFGLGLIILIFGNWIGVLLPFVMGAISLFKDPKIRELYQALIGA